MIYPNADSVTMGVYRSVFCETSCERCAARYRAEVQFQTGDDRQQEYAVGQKIPPDHGLAPDHRFDGVAVRFCPDCERSWDAAHQHAMHEALARYVMQGRMTMLDESGSPVTPESLRAWGRETVNAILTGPLGSRRPHLVLRAFTWDGEMVDVANLDFTKTHDADVTAALVFSGWPQGRDSLRDLHVCIGPDMTISVFTSDGAPFTAS